MDSVCYASGFKRNDGRKNHIFHIGQSPRLTPSAVANNRLPVNPVAFYPQKKDD